MNLLFIKIIIYWQSETPSVIERLNHPIKHNDYISLTSIMNMLCGKRSKGNAYFDYAK